MDNYPQLETRPLPAPPHWSKAIGVGIVVMGLAIGTGELILWPHLITKHGLSLLWLGILVGALILNVLASQVGLVSWFEFVKNPQSATLMSYLWLFLLYPAGLGLIAYMVKSYLKF